MKQSISRETNTITKGCIIVAFVILNGVFCNNIVVFLSSDIGHNDVSWNNDKVLSPNLDQLSKDGIIQSIL